ncbi:MAG: prephenate dehydrogenase/arogenate dehydrogenase family protein [Candidatus Odinarchaeia archaeon]
MKVAVIGGTGRLGRWIARFLKSEGFEVIITHPDKGKVEKIAAELGVEGLTDNKEAASKCDGVIISVPIKITPQVILEVAPYIKENGFLIDVSSVKTEAMNAMEKAAKNVSKKVHFLGVHPMFGPGAVTLKGKNVILIPCPGSEKFASTVEQYLKRKGAKVTYSNVEDHDKMVALTLSLPHLMGIVFPNVIKEFEDVRKLKLFAGTSFNLLLILSESICHENYDLYASIQMDNPMFQNVLDVLISKINKMRKIISEKDVNAFKRMIEDNRQYLSKDQEFKNSYKRQYEILEKNKE